jgi:integrase
MPRITKTTAEAASPDPVKDVYLWDDTLKGFGVKVTKNGTRTYLIQYRLHGRSGRTRRVTLGKHGTITTDQVRKDAKRLLGEVASGIDPAERIAEAKRDITFSDLCDLYVAALDKGEILTRSGVQKKESTTDIDKGRIARHIKPLLGRKRLKSIDQKDIKRFMKDIAAGKTSADVKTGKHGRAIVTGGKGTATRTVGLLSGIFSFAVDQDYLKINPVHGVQRYPDAKSKRFLSTSEMASLGDALGQSEKNGENPKAIAIIRLLCLTGCRKGEIETLKWSNIDLERKALHLTATKTGDKTIPLGPPALELLSSLSRHDQSEFVFPGDKGGHYVGLPKVWRRVRELAKLEDVRLHDLRHSFASVGVGAGLSLPIIGKMLGHSQAETTQRYAHLANDPLVQATDSVSTRIAASMTNQPETDNIVAIRDTTDG